MGGKRCEKGFLCHHDQIKRGHGGKREWRIEGKEKRSSWFLRGFLGGKFEKGRGSGGESGGNLSAWGMYTFCTCPLKAILAWRNVHFKL